MSNDGRPTDPAPDNDPYAPFPVELKNPPTAIFLAWLIPGAGHFYQGRTGKAILFFTCILSTYFLGLSMGGGRCVYAKWDTDEKRLPLICQVGVGLPTLPALGQALLVRNEGEPIVIAGVPFMAPPSQDENSEIHRRYGYLFELGTLYTMIAGLLNVLVIYDAAAGPVWTMPEAEKKRRAKLTARQKKEAAQKPMPSNDEKENSETISSE